MAEPPLSPAAVDAWRALADAVAALQQALAPPPHAPAQLQALAGAYAAVAAAYVRAIATTGRTSMRAEAAARALDLRTPKSALLHFLGRGDGAPG